MFYTKVSIQDCNTVQGIYADFKTSLRKYHSTGQKVFIKKKQQQWFDCRIGYAQPSLPIQIPKRPKFDIVYLHLR